MDLSVSVITTTHMINKNKSQPFVSNSQVSQLDEPEDISIVMAVYNHENTVAEAIESALMQEMPYTSVIYCLNDASSDKSAEILDDYAKRYPDKIKVFTSSKNQGSGKKSFLHHRPPVKGRYWCLLAGDDYWTSREKLARQIAFLDKCGSRYIGCSCNTVLRNEITGEDRTISPEQNTWSLLDLIRRDKALYVHTSSLVWRNIYRDRDTFLPPPFKKEGMHGDVMLMHTMLYGGGKIRNIPETMSCYRVTGRGIWTKQSLEEQAQAYTKIIEYLSHSLPFKYRILLFLQNWWRRLKRLLFNEQSAF